MDLDKFSDSHLRRILLPILLLLPGIQLELFFNNTRFYSTPLLMTVTKSAVLGITLSLIISLLFFMAIEILEKIPALKSANQQTPKTGEAQSPREYVLKIAFVSCLTLGISSSVVIGLLYVFNIEYDKKLAVILIGFLSMLPTVFIYLILLTGITVSGITKKK